MAFDLKKLKKRDTLKELRKKVEDERAGNRSAPDERLYKPRLSKKGNNTATLRFLPPQNGGDVVVGMNTVSFKGKNGNYWEKSRDVENEEGRMVKDPAIQARINAFVKNKEFPGQGYDDIAKDIKENQRFYANVLVVEDSEQPEREGEVWIMEFGPRIKGFIDEAILPKFADVEAIDPFCLWEGHDLVIRMQAKKFNDATVPNYDASVFSPVSREVGDDEYKQEIMEKTHDLDDFVLNARPGPYKSYGELVEQFEKKYGKPFNWLASDYVESYARGLDEEKPKSAEAPKPKSEDAKPDRATKEAPPWDESDSFEAPDEDTEEETDDDSESDEGDNKMNAFKQLMAERKRKKSED